jgi:hypothetical protein
MNRKLLATALVAGLTLLSLDTSRASAEEHPRLHSALFEMRHARTDLKEAKHDFGGHRARAVAALDEAIIQVDKALKAVGDNIRGKPAGKDAYKGYANHPHIRHALGEAREARAELRAAAHDYKGHREKAVQALNEVIDQLEKALRFVK